MIISKVLEKVRKRLFYSYHYRIKKGCCGLEKHLLDQGKDRWLDVGCSINDSNLNFYFTDLYPIEECIDEMKSRYFQLDISEPIEESILTTTGSFDLIRMQHVFEHFTYEKADVVLENCFKLLKPEGTLLITVPDLDIYVRHYKNKDLKSISSFGPWAHKRIDEDSPQSDYFSIFTHSLPFQKHWWCYNKEGLINKVRKSGKYKNIGRLSLYDSMSGIPFTHNRPEEDLCVIAIKK